MKAKALNCASKTLESCGYCLSCKKITAGNHPDVRVIDFNWQAAYFFADDTAPLLPAGTILHQIAIFDNTANNRHNPDATVWVGYGQRSVDEMCNTHVTAVFLSDDDFKRQVAERQAKRR